MCVCVGIRNVISESPAGRRAREMEPERGERERERERVENGQREERARSIV